MNRTAFNSALLLLTISVAQMGRAQNLAAEPTDTIDRPAQSATAPTEQAPQKATNAAPTTPQWSSVQAQTSAPAAGPAPALNSAEGDYVLQPGDTVEMNIFREPDLTSKSSIARDGTVQFPLIQEVKLAGLTVRNARDLVRKLYNDHYLVNPQVYLSVAEFAQRKFTILGQILKPGSYQLEGAETLTLLEAVGTAGGFTRTANEGNILVKRTVDGKNQSIKANAKRMAAGKDEPLVVLPGDVITVGESWY